ncbi:MAG: Prephenate dehydratase [Caldanaerobacter subterraneus]|uniref:Prephenate dehydratase n=1 Tax=Caldanaerobacter subterraneus TaxID=911092 RepID=A0A101E5B3_9THEO|nr:prephenate dehydratase [Caldanaerobacter subterraneus]KUK08747.1 MAG: Prephenate dehydratase [Caldanaerobacter subterraneus]HBT50470.1 prephenate dehydratase [Caldanaerobacter subterraneus]
MKVGYLGPKGTFSEEAVFKYIEGMKECEAIEFATIQDVVKSVAEGTCDEGILPVENSIEGSVNVSLDLLINDAEGILVRGEVIISISQCLICDDFIDFKDVHCILSHPQALAQCREYILNNFPTAEVKTTESTVKALLEVNAKKGIVAIGPERAAWLYNLKILEKDVQDIKENYTRFLVIAKRDSDYTGEDKTSIVFSVPNVPGSLYRALGVFAEKNINMTKIESRPSRKKFGEYVFWVDIEGHREEERIKGALEELKVKADFLKVIGSYPKFKMGK